MRDQPGYDIGETPVIFLQRISFDCGGMAAVSVDSVRLAAGTRNEAEMSPAVIQFPFVTSQVSTVLSASPHDIILVRCRNVCCLFVGFGRLRAAAASKATKNNSLDCSWAFSFGEAAAVYDNSISGFMQMTKSKRPREKVPKASGRLLHLCSQYQMTSPD